MQLSEKQRRFINFVWEDNKKEVDVDNYNAMFRTITLNLFQMYLISENENEKKNIAWQIHSIREDLKERIGLWHLIENKNEFIKLLKSKLKEKEQQSKLQHRRRHERRQDFSLTDNEWEEVKGYFNYKCAYCGNEGKLTYDHFHPFSKGGDFMKGNIIPSCSVCNSSKNNKLFSDWYPKQPFYNEKRTLKLLNYIDENKQLTLLV